jgi:hypothetical protein
LSGARADPARHFRESELRAMFHSTFDDAIGDPTYR